MSLAFIAIFRSASSILAKEVLRGGGDTRFLLVADTTGMWLLAILLGTLAGLVWGWTHLWVFIFFHADQIVETGWRVFRLSTAKWIKKIKNTA